MLLPPKRQQSFAEEIANTVSHGIALVACLIATPFLLSSASRRGDAWSVVGAAVFAGAMIFMYLSSALYHLLSEHRAKQVLRVVDHVAVFLLIAGTYTPFTLGVLRGAWGWTLFSIVLSHPLISTGLYLAMGWLMVVAIRPLWLKLPLPGILLLIAGGIAYTVGVAFFAAERVRYSHFVWHLFVVLGTICHFFAVMWYVD